MLFKRVILAEQRADVAFGRADEAHKKASDVHNALYVGTESKDSVMVQLANIKLEQRLYAGILAVVIPLIVQVLSAWFGK